MRHPTEGTLRRLIDEPAGVADVEREHVVGCRECLAGLAAALEDAAVTATALDVAPTTEVDAAWQRLVRATAVEAHRPVPAATSTPRWRTRFRSPAFAAVGVLALVTGASAAAAADWLQIFHTEEIAPVTLTQADLVRLPDLSAYGDVEWAQEPDVREVADARAAEKTTGLSVPQVEELPQGVTGEPMIQVGSEATAVFTFSVKQAEEAAAEEGDALPPAPAGLDGNRFRLVAGPGVAQMWSSNQGLPALVVSRAVAPSVYSSGVSFETARDYLLSLPGIPENLATQLRGFGGDRTTLPLPVPASEARSAEVEVDGVPATVFASRDGTMAGVIWVDGDIVTAVAGSLSDDEVLSVARGLRSGS
jgi:hypothetical protein